VPTAGWYPDPDGTPNRLRYWTGTAWTDQTRTGPGRDHRRLLLIAVAALVVVVLVIAVVVLRQHRSAAIRDSDAPPSSTVSGWDDSSPLPTPTPPRTPTPSASRSGDPTAGASPQTLPSGRPEVCDQYAHNQLREPPADGRVHGGPLSFARLGEPWSGPAALNRFPFSRDAHVQSQTMHEELGWQASAEVGVNTLRPFPGAQIATSRLLQCLVTSDFYTSVDVRVTENTVRTITISGRPAVQRDALLRFHHPRLRTTGSRVRIIVVDSDPVTYYFHAVPMERHDLISELDRATSSLRLD
jgi:hypothetical protein